MSSIGVIYCTDRSALVQTLGISLILLLPSAQANGFSASDPEWANLGQGAPEVRRVPSKL